MRIRGAGERILVLEPPTIPHGDRDTGFKEFLPHIGIGYIAGALRDAGHTVRVIDAPAERVDLRRLAHLVADFRPSLAGLTATTYQVHEAAEAARVIKEVSPRTRVALGGYHASALPDPTLREFPPFDYLVFGEGETTAVELAASFREGSHLPSIPGLAWREAGTPGAIRENPARAVAEDLDALPFPAFDLFPLGRYRGFYTFFSWRRRPVTLSTTRGCPYRCNFCFKSTGTRLRKRSVPNLMEEIERDLTGLGANQIVFTDEIFTLDRARALVLCEAMASRGVPRRATWICQSRADRVDPEVLSAMRRAGCAVVSYGIEAGNQTILDRIDKSLRLETAFDAIRWTKQAGISADTNFILGHPFETPDTIRDTIRFARRLNPDSTSFAILSPFPGTEVARMAERGEGGLRLLSRDWRHYGKQIGAALEHEGISRSELERFHRLAYFSFYARPSRIHELFRVVNLRAIPVYLLHSLRVVAREAMARRRRGGPRRKPNGASISAGESGDPR